MALMEGFLDGIDTFVAWMSSGLKQTTDAYCDVQTVDSEFVLVNHDGALFSIIEVHGANALIGRDEFSQIHDGVLQSLAANFSRPGTSMQVLYSYNKDQILRAIEKNFEPAKQTAKQIRLDVGDLFEERLDQMSYYCSDERVFLVLYTLPLSLTREQMKQANKDKAKAIKKGKIPAFRYTQNLVAAIPELRDSHDALVSSIVADLDGLNVSATLLTAKEALCEMRKSVDVDFTDPKWQPVIPGEKIKIKMAKSFRGDVSDILWPSLSHQLVPRDAYNKSLKVAQVADKIYGAVFIDLFPKEVQSFAALLSRTINTDIPWRISFMMDSDGLSNIRLKKALASVLSFASSQNRLINEAVDLLTYIDVNTDDAVVRLRVSAATWAPIGEEKLLRSRVSILSRAIQGWGSCDVSEVCGDAYEGIASSMLAMNRDPVATSTIASFSDVLQMLPLFRPSSPWMEGSLLFRSPDGKLWPYQPGSPLQTTWIDVIYARPGSGKSVLSNAINLALCLQGGLARLPRISVIDIGPSSSGLISLLKEALPDEQRHLVAYHRLQMRPEYSINPFDTHLGCRYPFPQERAFLVNFVTLLTTPIGAESPYDGMPDMIGLVVDEAYKVMADDGNPNIYTHGVEEMIDAVLEEIGFISDTKTTWWEVVDALFMAGYVKEANIAQRNAVPLLSDLTSVARIPAVEDLYGKITISTGESLIASFVRMLSSAVREYPILSRYTRFDLGNAKIISLDLDEVAKTGGDAADRQTAVMYMLARYVLAKDYYLNQDSLSSVNPAYREHHNKEVLAIRDDHKRLVMDEFHRTSKAQAVRDQVIVDMREGRKWKVQIALLSQSIEDFSSQMVDFATSIFIMDAGPEQAVRRTSEVFGLTSTAQLALKQSVRGPRAGGATFLAQFSTKQSVNTQLLTLTLGPIELWAFTTTAEDVQIRTKLYELLGPREARRVLANLFPNGSATKYLSQKAKAIQQESGVIDEEVRLSLVGQLVSQIIDEYKINPDFKSLGK